VYVRGYDDGNFVPGLGMFGLILHTHRKREQNSPDVREAGDVLYKTLEQEAKLFLNCLNLAAIYRMLSTVEEQSQDKGY
jgi:hypothetical protein